MAFETLFIGREAELKRLEQDVFFVKPNSRGFCYSLIGLNGIGKTTLISKLSEEFKENRPENTFYFSTEITAGVSFWLFWTMLVLKFSKSISENVLQQAAGDSECDYTEEILEIYDFFTENKSNVDTSDFRSQAIIYLTELFPYYTEMGIRIIITIDEFDRARDNFDDGQFFQFLFNLSPKSVTQLNLSIITISRRRVSTIAHHMQEGSNFEDAYPPLPLKGFNDMELAAYFDTYEQLPCGLLPKDVQKQILYLCGRSPGLLMRLRHEFEVMSDPNTDIGWIYAEHGQFIKNAYSRMITLMETTFADRAHLKPLLEVFIQKFIGPAYDDNFGEELPLLYDYGFVTKGSVESNIFSLSGAHIDEKDSHAGSEIVYEPIAPYFVEYIKHTIIPNDLANLSSLLIKAEKLIRELIEKEMRKAFPDTWEDIINGYAGKKDYYLETLQIRALQNDFSSSSISKLNVISFKEYYYIINNHWSIFSKYFSAYPNKNALFAAMSLLSESRNDSAHLNLVVYNGESRRKLREACNLFISCVETPPAANLDPNIPTSLTDDQIEKLVSEGATFTFCCQAIKMPKRNLRGIIKEYGYPAGVAQKNLAAFCFTSDPKVGDEFAAVIERWDNNAKMFNLKAPG